MANPHSVLRLENLTRLLEGKVLKRVMQSGSEFTVVCQRKARNFKRRYVRIVIRSHGALQDARSECRHDVVVMFGRRSC